MNVAACRRRGKPLRRHGRRRRGLQGGCRSFEKGRRGGHGEYRRLQKGERPNQVGLIHRELQRDRRTAGVAADVRARDAHVFKQRGRVRRMVRDDHRRRSMRASGPAPPVVSRQVATRVRRASRGALSSRRDEWRYRRDWMLDRMEGRPSGGSFSSAHRDSESSSPGETRLKAAFHWLSIPSSWTHLST
jgi:hypothetical protein